MEYPVSSAGGSWKWLQLFLVGCIVCGCTLSESSLHQQRSSFSVEAERHRAGLQAIIANSPVIGEDFDKARNETIITGRSSLVTYERQGDSYYYMIASAWIVCRGRGACSPDHVLMLFTAGSGGDARHEDPVSRQLTLRSEEDTHVLAEAGYQREAYIEPHFNQRFVTEYLLVSLDPRDFLRLVEETDARSYLGDIELSQNAGGFEGFEALAALLRTQRGESREI